MGSFSLRFHGRASRFLAWALRVNSAGLMQRLIDEVFALSERVRAVAVYRDGDLVTRIRPGAPEPWSPESDRYEELLVNPALLTLIRQRGELDRGGARYAVIRYDKFFRLLVPIDQGHVSVCIEPSGQPLMLAGPILQLLDRVVDPPE